MFEMASLLLLLQNMLLEIEEKVLALSELSMHSENLLLEGRTETREEAEQLARKLRILKGGLLELQKMLQDKQITIQVRGLHVLNVMCARDDKLFIMLLMMLCYVPTMVTHSIVKNIFHYYMCYFLFNCTIKKRTHYSLKHDNTLG